MLHLQLAIPILMFTLEARYHKSRSIRVITDPRLQHRDWVIYATTIVLTWKRRPSKNIRLHRILQMIHLPSTPSLRLTWPSGTFCSSQLSTSKLGSSGTTESKQSDLLSQVSVPNEVGWHESSLYAERIISHALSPAFRLNESTRINKALVPKSLLA